MPVTPRPGIHDYCVPCFGWGVHTVNNSTDYEDELECVDCHGTGTREKEETWPR